MWWAYNKQWYYANCWVNTANEDIHENVHSFRWIYPCKRGDQCPIQYGKMGISSYIYTNTLLFLLPPLLLLLHPPLIVGKPGQMTPRVTVRVPLAPFFFTRFAGLALGLEDRWRRKKWRKKKRKKKRKKEEEKRGRRFGSVRDWSDDLWKCRTRE